MKVSADFWPMATLVITIVGGLVAAVWALVKSFAHGVQNSFDLLNASVSKINDKMEKQGELVVKAVTGLANVEKKLELHDMDIRRAHERVDAQQYRIAKLLKDE
jgi:hypothetical protein